MDEHTQKPNVDSHSHAVDTRTGKDQHSRHVAVAQQAPAENKKLSLFTVNCVTL